MPILPAEPDLHPADLFARAAPPPWSVAYVRSRREKALARALVGQDVPFYLPLHQREAFPGGRRRLVHLPLFPGYVFLPDAGPHRLAIQKTNLVVQHLAVADPGRLHRELASLRRLQESGAPLVPHPDLGPGDEVEVTAGPFKGWTGRILREQGGLRLVVTVSFLRQAVAATFDRDVLAPRSSNARIRREMRRSWVARGDLG